MRQDIKMLCVTNWGAVVEFKWWINAKKTLARIADTDAVDAGMIISRDEIKLVARIKRK